ncbi:ArsC/Spx/MgsR family protein [Spiribacter halobius]|uniref:Arsenate reductase n=1 Tax=Sediminicurvatus halobius TaxID=2182432 RepID=A0A2U2N466_9GAMM|nr:ArsC/Spx/MgsR family protein [Spiribacter halobius]PWG63900.1 hypothetical protein DEM34_06790 [Spiribacter halobius]UEX76312.1 hypothetical protein LMH63_10060 [Spiribacter halobius]
MSAVRVYGLASCDRCRRARQWLAARGSEVEFVDLARTGLEPATLDRWLDALPWEALLNRRSTSWRALPLGRREGLARISRRSAKRGRGDGGQDKARESSGAQAYSTVRRAPEPSATQDCPPDPRPQPRIGEKCGLDEARALMLEEPRLVKRPVLETQDTVQVGFDPDAWERVL